MIIWYKVYEKQFLVSVIFVILLLWSLIASFKLITTNNEVVLIKMSELETKVITEDDAENTPIEVENFLNNFIGYFYNYTSENYESHIEKALGYMSLEQAEEYVPRLNSMYDQVKKTHTLQSATIIKIEKVKSYEFIILIRVIRSVEGKDTEDDYKLKLYLTKTLRTLSNPYGIEVLSIEEDIS